MWLNSKFTMRFLQALREIWQRETNSICTIEPLCFIHLNIAAFYSPRSIEYRIPGNNTQKLEDLYVFKGWCGSPHFPDWLFMVRSLTLQAFQAFTLFVHVKMKRSFVSNNALFDDHIIKATGDMSHCANGPQPDCHGTVTIVSLVSKVWPRLPSQPIALHGRIHLKCKPDLWPHSWNF